MPRHILSLDQGTTSSRAIVFNQKGEIVSVAQEEFNQIFPQPGWVEHNAVEIWETQLNVAREAIKKAGLAPIEIAGIGITNQRETGVLWDRKTGEPLGNAIVWQDRRTAEYCRELVEAGHSERIQELTGLIIDAYFSGTKLKWMLDHYPDARKRAEAGELAFGTIDSWLAWNLSGGELHITDVSNASRTMLCDIRNVSWSEELLALFEIPAAVLPEIRSSSEFYGDTAEEVFGDLIPISGIAGDQQAALFGQACHHPGMAKNTYGTGCFMLKHTGSEFVRSNNNLLTTIAWQIDGTTEYALEGSVFIGGAVVQWLRDQLGIIEASKDVEALALEVKDNGGVFFVPAFTGLGAPHWDGFARGTISGLTRGAGKAHIARAALEAIAFQSHDLMQAMIADTGIELSELRVDGGASRNDLLMQFQADLLGVPVVRSQVSETTAFGAAFLAGLAAGVWSSKKEIAAIWAESSRFNPGIHHATMQETLAKWHKAVERTLL
ncbi:MAG: glycerol kinase [Verrucomicrobiales bacterium]|jgi:glycerol kinase|nr:glycerol kinase [Verrucomicrobiales bacterium]